MPGDNRFDTRNVPHGAVAEVLYDSNTLGRHRRLHVYTPPGYEANAERYPVLYLLHGAGDSDDSWSTVGRAGMILDNLIAAGDAVPMLVVMPAGHTRANGGGAMGDAGTAEFALDRFAHVGVFSSGLIGAFGDREGDAPPTLSEAGARWETAHAAALADAPLRSGLRTLWFATASCRSSSGRTAATPGSTGATT